MTGSARIQRILHARERAEEGPWSWDAEMEEEVAIRARNRIPSVPAPTKSRQQTALFHIPKSFTNFGFGALLIGVFWLRLLLVTTATRHSVER